MVNHHFLEMKILGLFAIVFLLPFGTFAIRPGVNVNIQNCVVNLTTTKLSALEYKWNQAPLSIPKNACFQASHKMFMDNIAIIFRNGQEQMSSPNLTQEQMSSLNLTQEQMSSPNLTQEQMSSLNLTQEQMSYINRIQEQMGSLNLTQEQMRSLNLTQEQIMSYLKLMQEQNSSLNVMQEQMIPLNLTQNKEVDIACLREYHPNLLDGIVKKLFLLFSVHTSGATTQIYTQRVMLRPNPDWLWVFYECAPEHSVVKNMLDKRMEKFDSSPYKVVDFTSKKKTYCADSKESACFCQVSSPMDKIYITPYEMQLSKGMTLTFDGCENMANEQQKIVDERIHWKLDGDLCVSERNSINITIEMGAESREYYEIWLKLTGKSLVVTCVEPTPLETTPGKEEEEEEEEKEKSPDNRGTPNVKDENGRVILVIVSVATILILRF